MACLSGSSFSLGQGTGHLTDDLDDLDDLDVERTAAEAPNEKTIEKTQDGISGESYFW